VKEYEAGCDGMLKIDVSCTNNGLLLIEAEKI